MKRNKYIPGAYKWHVLFWLLFISYKIAFENIRVTLITDNVDTFFIYIIYIANFYFVLYILLRFFNQKKVLFFSFLILGYVSYILFLHLYCKILIQKIGHGLYYSHLTWVDTFIDGTDLYLQFSFYALGFWFVSRNINTQNKLAQAKVENSLLHANNLTLHNNFLKLETEKLKLVNENLQLQNAKLEAEYNHLKAQINPHFLFNTLNTLYSNTERVLPETAKGIMLLSDIMRYSLETGDADGKVALAEELTQLSNYIGLMQLRFENQLQIKGNLFAKQTEPNLEGTERWRILPHLLITMAENAFKHGNNCEPFIINLFLNGPQLHFTFQNAIGMRKTETGTGIGLQNMVNRLKHTYGNDCRFESGVHDNIYILQSCLLPTTMRPPAKISISPHKFDLCLFLYSNVLLLMMSRRL